MRRPQPLPVFGIGKALAHRHDASLARLSTPDEDRKCAGHAIGNVVGFAARVVGCELAAHQGTLHGQVGVHQ